MEQARVFIAIALSFLVFFVWEMFFVDKEAMKPAPQSSPVVEETQTAQTPNLDEKTPAPASVLTPAPPSINSRQIVVNTPHYAVTLDERGAMVRHFRLTQYRESTDENSPLMDVVKSVADEGTLTLVFDGSGMDAAALTGAVFQAQTDKNAITVTTPMTLPFVWVSPSGVVVEKRFHFDPDQYFLGLQVVVTNQSDAPVDGRMGLAINTRKPEKTTYGFQGPCLLIGGNFETIEYKKIADNAMRDGDIGWIALQDQYFMSAVIPENGQNSQMRLSTTEDGLATSQFFHPRETISSGQSATFNHHIFFGPKSTEVLGGVGDSLERAVHFGMFDVIAKPCLSLMRFFYSVIPNYGLAIIVLTILIKIVLWPLGNKSYKSMSQMKRMQPLMAEIREKHKNDKKKMNEELMNLYRVYKINPMGGCLPMILQIPVFFALYRMLYEAIELRHAPFFGWITDLSAPDRLFNFGFSIPFMEPPYGIPVLTLVMGGTMFLQQKMSPPPGDPTQAKMMMFMPIVFTFIFINFSSGLVLYWLVNNVLSIAQQYHVQKKYA